MNMIASLKALLFASTPVGATGKADTSAVPDGTADFAAMIDAARLAPNGSPAAASDPQGHGAQPLAMPQASMPDPGDNAPLPDAPAVNTPVPTDGDALPLPAAAPAVPPSPSAPIAAAPKPHAPGPLPITQQSDDPQTAPPAPAAPMQSVAQLLVAAHIAPTEAAVIAPQQTPAPAIAPSDAMPVTDADAEPSDIDAARPEQPDAPPQPPAMATMPLPAAPLPATPVSDTPAKPAPKAEHHVIPEQGALTPAPAPTVAPSDATPVTDADVEPSDIETERPEQPDAPPQPSTMVMLPPPAAPLPATPPQQSPDAPSASSPATVQPAVAPAVTIQPVGDQPQSIADLIAEQPVTPIASATPTGTVTVPSPILAPDPAPTLPEPASDAAPIINAANMSSSLSARAEALSLLQLARQHMARQSAPSPAAGGDTAPADAPVAAITDAMPGAIDPAVPAPAAPPLTIPTVAPALPAVDLSATLGAQVVDMGVSGQWIDSLARDIAGLSANGAQGRFQISSDQLGPIDVSIRQGIDGAAVSLTVSSDIAEAALRQDSDRLRLDAGLSAVRISEVKIERAPHVGDAARSDPSSQQQPSQQQQGQHNGPSANWQGAGQGMGQSQQQGRWQQRENIALAHKAGGDPAVLNHEQTGDTASQAIRARYA
ncbi:flagellar hook-length control protein FliK [Sphingobium sp. B2]|uniref:flagellar hook-length control protein FliK n=1 Tax=Sphingobium sp. B2 TaxID=2583228 RepID=UPI0011A7AC67|nr:flagellar hook-length control protein FliK [Sphingobium sp. B2]